MTTVLFLLVALAACCFAQDVQDCGFHSCRELKQAKPEYTSGEYWFSNGKGGLYRAFCQFESNHGYMFISKEAVNEPINFNLIGHSTTEVLVRHQRVDSRQYDTTMKQIIPHYPLSVQYNANIGFNTPVNHNTMAPYIYLGFLPKSYAANRNKQGYKANCRDFKFRNSDRNPNSYLAFFFNQNHALPNGYYKRCCYTKLMRDWIDVATPATTYLPNQYFFQFEMHMGGGGGYAVNGFNTLADIWGAALGLHFDL